MPTPNENLRAFTRAWVFLCFALMVHVADEALTGFLDVYNPTVVALRARLGWWPMPTFTFGSWLAGLIVVCLVLLVLSLWVVRGSLGARIAAYVFGVIMLLNGIGHTLGTIFGRTVAGVTFTRPMPGFYSSMLLIPVSVYLLLAARRLGNAGGAGVSQLRARSAGLG